MSQESPEVGEEFEQISKDGHTSVATHIRVGEILKVTYVQGRSVTFDRCFCGRELGTGCTWTWSAYRDIFRLVVKLTPEEIANAKPLPDVEDVAGFFGVKP